MVKVLSPFWRVAGWGALRNEILILEMNPNSWACLRTFYKNIPEDFFCHFVFRFEKVVQLGNDCETHFEMVGTLQSA